MKRRTGRCLLRPRFHAREAGASGGRATVLVEMFNDADPIRH